MASAFMPSKIRDVSFNCHFAFTSADERRIAQRHHTAILWAIATAAKCIHTEILVELNGGWASRLLKKSFRGK
jgi:hypothetical protein